MVVSASSAYNSTAPSAYQGGVQPLQAPYSSSLTDTAGYYHYQNCYTHVPANTTFGLRYKNPADLTYELSPMPYDKLVTVPNEQWVAPTGAIDLQTLNPIMVPGQTSVDFTPPPGFSTSIEATWCDQKNTTVKRVYTPPGALSDGTRYSGYEQLVVQNTSTPATCHLGLRFTQTNGDNITYKHSKIVTISTTVQTPTYSTPSISSVSPAGDNINGIPLNKITLNNVDIKAHHVGVAITTTSEPPANICAQNRTNITSTSLTLTIPATALPYGGDGFVHTAVCSEDRLTIGQTPPPYRLLGDPKLVAATKSAAVTVHKPSGTTDPTDPTDPNDHVDPVVVPQTITGSIPASVKIKTRKQIKLPVRTTGGSRVKWVNRTPKICKIKAGKLVSTGRQGTCRVTATAPSFTNDLYLFTVLNRVYAIKYK